MAFILYHAWRCPFCMRTRIVFDEKGLEYDDIEVDLANKPAALLERSPKGKVPVVEDDGVVIYESHVIDEYLEERFPEPRLMPEDVVERARVRLLHDFCDSELVPALFALAKVTTFAPADGDAADPAAVEAARSAAIAKLDRLAQALGERDFLLGRFGLADITLAPWVVRLARFGLGRDDVPGALRSWIERLQRRDSIARNTAVRPGDPA